MTMNSITHLSIFGEYKNPEDKVTAALLQVLHYGGHNIVCSLFEDIDLPSNEINVRPQVVEDESRPDGVVSCNCVFKIIIESKITSNALSSEHGKTQLEAHKKLSSPNDAQWVVYITPDQKIPQELEKDKSGIIWINWQKIVEKLKGYETSDNLIKFLIEQFCIYVDHVVFKSESKLLSPAASSSTAMLNEDQRVIIVGGAWGEDVALNYHFYACQEGRYFLPAKYLAFYHKNRIKYLFEIEEILESTSLTVNLVGPKYLKVKESNYNGEHRKFFKLKPHHTFCPEIKNDTVDKNGNPCAFLYKQRYTAYSAIMSASKTSDL